VSTPEERVLLAEHPPVTEVAAAQPDEAGIARRERLKLLLHSKTFIAGAVLLGFWIFCALFGRAIVPESPFATDILAKLAEPSGDHWFGTDSLGRDVFSRVIAGARDILIVAPLATLLGTVLGTALGLLTGYFRGVVDDVLMRLVDAFLALPVVILGLVALVALGASRITVIFVIGIVFAPIIARTVRAAVLSERELEYVAAARLRNERGPRWFPGPWYIMFAEILPNIAAPILVEFTVRLGYAIFAIATLSFLGFGIQPPAPDWGLQIAEHYGLISGGYWWPTLFPAVAIATLVVGVNLIADGITHAFER
jgi:peptide/nickel transport system permease protein